MGLTLLTACHRTTAPTGAATSQASETLATFGDVTITQADLDFLAAVAPPQIQAQLHTAPGRLQAVNDMIDRELLYAESVHRDLAKDALLKKQIAFHERVLIANAALQDEVKRTAEQYYQEHAEEFTVVPLQHILIKFGTKDAARSEIQAVQLANQLKARIEKGEAFEKVAAENSDDLTTKKRGGLLGRVWKHEPGLMRRGYEALLEQAFTIAPGTVAGPFKTSEGYHLIRIAEAAHITPLGEARTGIELKLRNTVRTDFVKQLRAKSTIHLSDVLTKNTNEKPK